MPMELTEQKILRTAFSVEGMLMLVFMCWAYIRGFPLGAPSLLEVKTGILFCAPILFFNFLLFGPLSDHLALLKPCYDFKNTVVKPLAEQLNFFSAFLVSLSAGFGEELFFRGLLQTEFGLLISSLAFCFLHFGFAIVRYRFIAGIYLLIGFYFGLICQTSHSLWPPIITHALYDFLALLYMRYWVAGTIEKSRNSPIRR